MGRAHAQALSILGVRLVAICDRHDGTLQDTGEALGVPPAQRYPEIGALLAAHPSLDLVVVATTADAHFDSVCAAARGGARRILCEKPMARSVADCDAMIVACEEAGALLAVNHQMRFMDQYQIVRNALDSGRFGRLASMNVVAGCFGLAMNGSHYVEAFSYLTGTRPQSVAARFSPERLGNPRGPQFEDQAGEIRVVGESGQRLSLEVSADQGHGMTVTYAAQWGHLFVDELEGECIATARDKAHREEPTTRYGMPWQRATERFPQADNVAPTAAVARALLEGADYPDGAAGRQAVAVLAAAHRSTEESSRYVRLDELGSYYERRFAWA